MIKIVGDINFSDGFFDVGFGVGSIIRKGIDPFCNIKREKNDIWIGNCECVISDISNKNGISRNQFRVSPNDVSNVNHVDIYNVANNHVAQHGSDAYIDMLQNLENWGIDITGTKDKKYHIFEHQKRNIAIVSFSQRDEKFVKYPDYWYMPEYADIEKVLIEAKFADFKIAYIHWGIEFIDRPYIDQKRFAHWLIDIGFDLIVGLHPHVLQGYEVYNGKFIFYSLGNFVFNMAWEATRYSIVLNIDFEQRDVNISFEYIHIGSDFCPRIIEEKNVPHKYRFEYLNNRLKIENENELYYNELVEFTKKYRKSNYLYILRSLIKYRISDILSILLDFGKRKLKKFNLL